jgi:hypothetical protein
LKNKIGLVVAVFIFFAIGNEIYTQIAKKPKSAKSSRLVCQKKAITFERVLKPKLVKSLLETLKSGDYKVVVWADKAKYAKSVMFDYVDIDIIKDDFIQKIKKSKANNIQPQKTDDIFVDMMIYENDKKDPGKKTARSKLYAGYIEVTFKVHNKVVYLIQTDFMNLKGEDIPQRISCIVDSVMTLKE